MRRSAIVLTAGLLVTGCAGASGPDGPVVSPTGIVYDRGTPPTETRYSQTAALYLRQGRPQRALELAKEGLEADPENPVHYFLAGSAYLHLDAYEEADSMFVEAERIYPAYELDIEPERESAWAEAFNEGADAYDRGAIQEAIDAWKQAALIYDLRTEAHRNLASLLATEERYEEAIDIHRRALAGLDRQPATRVLEEAELQERERARRTIEERLSQLLLRTDRHAEAEPLLRRQLQRDSSSVQLRSDLARALEGQGRTDEAAEIYSTLLTEEELEGSQLFNLGVALFRAADFERAGEAFERLTRLQPHSRDAWFNYANSLFAAEAWEELIPIGDRLVELDPLGENTALIVARAHLEAGDEEAALQGLERAENAPVHVEQLQMRTSGGETRVHGRMVGNEADAGTPMRLRFTFYGGSEEIGTEVVTVPAPPADDSATFQVSIDGRASAYRYELVR